MIWEFAWNRLSMDRLHSYNMDCIIGPCICHSGLNSCSVAVRDKNFSGCVSTSKRVLLARQPSGFSPPLLLNPGPFQQKRNWIANILTQHSLLVAASRKAVGHGNLPGRVDKDESSVVRIVEVCAMSLSNSLPECEVVTP